MHEPTYRQALGHAWHTVWHNKILWIFGLLSLCLGQFGVNDFVGKVWMVIQKTLVIGQLPFFFQFDLKTSAGLIWIGLILLAVFILFLVISLISQGALIVGSAASLKNKQINLTRAWHRSTKHFWALFAINILRALTMTFLVIGLGIIWTILIMSHLPSILTNIILIFCLAITLFLGLVVSSWAIYALCYSVLDGKGTINAIKRGWKMLHYHLLVSLELNLLLCCILMLIFILFYLLIFFSAAPALLFWLIAGITGYFKLITIGLCLWAGLLFLLIIIGGAIFNAFSTSAWTYLFLKMHHEGIASRLFHYFKKIVSR